jgi:hypothetical protein
MISHKLFSYKFNIPEIRILIFFNLFKLRFLFFTQFIKTSKFAHSDYTMNLIVNIYS